MGLLQILNHNLWRRRCLLYVNIRKNRCWGGVISFRWTVQDVIIGGNLPDRTNECWKLMPGAGIKLTPFNWWNNCSLVVLLQRNWKKNSKLHRSKETVNGKISGISATGQKIFDLYEVVTAWKTVLVFSDLRADEKSDDCQLYWVAVLVFEIQYLFLGSF